MRPKKQRKIGIIWNIPKEALQTLLDTCDSFRDILSKLDLVNRGGNNYKTLKKRIEQDNLDLTKLSAARKSKIARKPSLIYENCFCANSAHKTSTIRRKVLAENTIPYQCLECGNLGYHNGKKLMLQLDHINGINNDHRIENIRWLCPNCHSQTPTFAGKKQKEENKCSCCHKDIPKYRTKCYQCKLSEFIDKRYTKDNLYGRTKITWPEPKELQKLLWEKPTTMISKELGVSDVAVGKFCKYHNLTKPPRGFWSKK